MVTIIGVRFRCAGKIYYFDPGDHQIAKGTKVIVETARGLEMGTVVLPNKEMEDDQVVQPLKPVIRLAEEADFQLISDNKTKEKEAYRICQEKIAKHELDMKLVDVEYTFDNNKILFYFTADGRIDFRELVKDLASVFKTRIELRQIGVRDETKMLGGVGICGRCLCCSTYLSEFIPVSIKMAKEQNLSLNPSKISGVCGRLMCCLKNEEETYEYLNSRLPSIGDTVVHKEDGVRGEVQSVNVLRQLVKVVVNLEGGDLEVREYPVDDLQFHCRRRKERTKIDDAELQQLEEMENLDKAPEEKRPRRERKPRNESRERSEEKRENVSAEPTVVPAQEVSEASKPEQAPVSVESGADSAVEDAGREHRREGRREGKRDNREGRPRRRENRQEGGENRQEHRGEGREGRQENRGEGRREHRGNHEGRREGRPNHRGENREERSRSQGENREEKGGRFGGRRRFKDRREGHGKGQSPENGAQE